MNKTTNEKVSHTSYSISHFAVAFSPFFVIYSTFRNSWLAYYNFSKIFLFNSFFYFSFDFFDNWIYYRRNDRLDWILLSIHFVLTITTFIYLQIPFILLKVNITNQNEFLNEVIFRIKLIPLAWALFIAGQILFLFYYFRIIKKQKSKI